MNRQSVYFTFLAVTCISSSLWASPTDGPSGTTRGFIDEMNRRPESYRGAERSGREIYLYRCKACHARATQGAPMVGDAIEWKMRAGQGYQVLMQHVVEGYNRGLMPARGGCENCSIAELRSAVDYMLIQSGVKISLDGR